MEIGLKYMAQTTNTDSASEKHRLSVQVSLNGFSFCILNQDKKQLVFLDQISFNEQLHPIQTEARLSHYFKDHLDKLYVFDTVQVSYVNELATFVPNALFNENHLVDYLKFNNKLFASDYIAHDLIASHDLVSVYVPYVNINNFFIDRFGQIEFKHFSTILVSHLLKSNALNTAQVVYAHIQEKQFELVVIENGTLRYYNSFSYETAEDFMYFTLFTLEQLKIDRETISFVFLGEVDKAHMVYPMAYNYIRNITFGDRENNMEISSKIPAIHTHAHYTLINALL
jgi:hypothetical protein